MGKKLNIENERTLKIFSNVEPKIINCNIDLGRNFGYNLGGGCALFGSFRPNDNNVECRETALPGERSHDVKVGRALEKNR